MTTRLKLLIVSFTILIQVELLPCGTMAQSGDKEPSADQSTAAMIEVFEEELEKDSGDMVDLGDLIIKSEESKTPPSKAVLVQAHQETSWAKASFQMARAAVKKAKMAKHPEVAQVYLRDAIQKASTARRWKRRAIEAVRTAPSRQTDAPRDSRPPPPRRRLGFGFKEGGALAQAVAIGDRDRGFMARSEPYMADAENFDPGSEVLTTSSGVRVNIRPVMTVIQHGSPGGKKGNPFVTTRTAQGRKAVRLKPHAVSVLASPEAKKVGGVKLEVTLDLLAYLGVAQFCHRGPVNVIKNPVLISLKRLHTRVSPFAASAREWEKLPGSFRYPGSIERIHGIVLDPVKKDVFIVGTRARCPESRLDIDALILGLQCVWSDGDVPSVSLDPEPGRPEGPQHSKVYNLPFNSIFAKIMLDADYAMKEITLGLFDVGTKSFDRMNRQTARRTDYHGGRLWLSPMPLGAGDVHVSVSSRTVLFECGVRCLTESKDAEGEYSGKIDPDDEKVANLFTSMYGKIENNLSIKPRAIFLRLHGLVDVVTACKFLRDIGIDYPILGKFARLPVCELKGDEAVPSFYDAMSVKWPDIESYICGGAVLRTRGTRRSLELFQDAVTWQLEQEVDSFPANSAVRSLNMTFTLPQARKDDRSRVAKHMLAGRRALQAKSYTRARGHFSSVVKEEPSYAQAWAYLGMAQAFLKKEEDALGSIARAVTLEPLDWEIALMEVEIRRNLGSRLNISSMPDWQRRSASTRYAERALGFLGSGDRQLSVTLATTAIELWDKNADAYAVRASARIDPLAKEAVSDRKTAIRLYREKKKTGDKTVHRSLAEVLQEDALARIKGLRYKFEGLYSTWRNNPDKVRAAFKEFDDIVKLAGEARELDEDLAAAWATEAMARGVRAKMMMDMGREPDLLSARNIAFKAVKRFPKFPDVHLALAMVATYQGAFILWKSKGRLTTFDKPGLSYAKEEVRKEVGEAIRLDPSYGEAYLFRAIYRVSFGEKAKGLEDFKKAKRLLPDIDPRIDQAFKKLMDRR